MAISLHQVQPSMEYLHPNINDWVLSGVRSLLPYWLRYRAGIHKIETRNIDRLVRLTQQFQAGKVKYILAFRHPTIDDQFAMLHLLSRNIPKAAARMGVKIKQPTHSFFVYDRGIPLWAGGIAKWLYPRVGGLPIYRGKADRQGFTTIRQHILTGEYPIAIAPEGGTNGHNELVSAIEPGVAQIAFWAAEDLEKAGRHESVVVLPVGIQYQYLGAPWETIDRLLMELERECGLTKPPLQPQERYQRLVDLGEYLIGYASDRYKKYYSAYAKSLPDDSASINVRLEALLNQILSVSEATFDITPKGSIVDRCRRLEQSVWERIFRNDIKDMQGIKALSTLERSFANQLAKEAHISEWHMRIAESLTAVTGNYVKENPSPTRFADTLLLIWRALSRVKSETFGRHPYIGNRKIIISIGEPISVRDRYETYKSSRAAAKECNSQLTKELQLALESLIELSPMEVE
ncbi:hypothetical protein [Pseudanabaena sp. PCC 6802]|uniref:hypothetical protein n=1 Tax=Pseudanabaena sp. PCC 6802 TaxID=118173 RepID=UPI00034AA9C4|nr:hypothetical protein [Pseudanabaena sp. PCC 6802]